MLGLVEPHKGSDYQINKVSLSKQSNNRLINSLEVLIITKIEEIPYTA